MSEAQAKSDSPRSAIDQVILRGYADMPAWVRILVYLAFALVTVHNTLLPNVLQGDFYLEQGTNTENKKNLPAVDYLISYGTNQIRVNSQGKWILPVKQVVPGKIKVSISSPPPDNGHLGTVLLPSYIPVVSSLKERNILIIRKQDGSYSVSQNSSRHGFDLVASAYAQDGGTQRTREAKPQLTVSLHEISVRQSGDTPKNQPAELYFVINVNGQHIKPSGFPEKGIPSTYLLTQDNTTTVFRDLSFRTQWTEQPTDILLSVFDRDYCNRLAKPFLQLINNAKCTDEQIGELRFTIEPNSPNQNDITIKSTKTGRFPAENIEITLSTNIES